MRALQAGARLFSGLVLLGANVTTANATPISFKSHSAPLDPANHPVVIATQGASPDMTAHLLVQGVSLGGVPTNGYSSVRTMETSNTFVALFVGLACLLAGSRRVGLNRHGVSHGP